MNPAERQKEREQQEQRVREQMSRVGRKLIVLSGKGGVGKSTVAANLAVALAGAGHRVGLLDVDVHGPSIPRIMGIEGKAPISNGKQIMPLSAGENLGVMSIGLLIQNKADAVIWRGPLKFGVIRQFLADVAWESLDYLVVDCPPGTGDEPLSVAQLVGRPAGAVIVTTPQELAINDVRRCVTFCEKVSLPVVGIVENMSGFVCPVCGTRTDLFGRGGGERLAREMKVPFLGDVPIEPAIVGSGDAGKPFLGSHPETEAGKAFTAIVEKIAAHQDWTAPAPAQPDTAAARGAE